MEEDGALQNTVMNRTFGSQSVVYQSVNLTSTNRSDAVLIDNNVYNKLTFD